MLYRNESTDDDILFHEVQLRRQDDGIPGLVLHASDIRCLAISSKATLFHTCAFFDCTVIVSHFNAVFFGFLFMPIQVATAIPERKGTCCKLQALIDSVLSL